MGFLGAVLVKFGSSAEPSDDDSGFSLTSSLLTPLLNAQHLNVSDYWRAATLFLRLCDRPHLSTGTSGKPSLSRPSLRITFPPRHDPLELLATPRFGRAREACLDLQPLVFMSTGRQRLSFASLRALLRLSDGQIRNPDLVRLRVLHSRLVTLASRRPTSEFTTAPCHTC